MGALAALPAGRRALFITNGVFSMDGDLGPLPAPCALTKEFGCIMMVDDARPHVFSTSHPPTIAMKLADRHFHLGVFAQDIGFPAGPA